MITNTREYTAKHTMQNIKFGSVNAFLSFLPQEELSIVNQLRRIVLA